MSRRPEHQAPPEVVSIQKKSREKNSLRLKHIHIIYVLSLQFYNEDEARKYTLKYANFIIII